MNNEEPNRLSLKIPNDLAYLPLALNFVREAAGLAGFDVRDRQRIELAVEEAAANVIQHAFAPGEKAGFEIRLNPMATGLEITIHDQGLPFDPTIIPDYRPAESLEAQSAAGLGSFLMKSGIDEVEFRNLGFQGKETRLFKRYPHPPFTADANDLRSHEDPPGAAPAPATALEVRQMRREEAVEVSRCFFDVYGYTYFHEHAYFPDRLAALNESGELFSAVAVTAEGEVASHAALSFSRFYPGIGELCMGATKRRFQGQKLTQKLNTALFEEAFKRNLTGIFSETVTVHTRSQRLVRQFSFRETAFLLAYLPAHMSFRGIADDVANRVSLLVCFYFLNPVAGTSRKLHMPPAHEAIIQEIYARFGIEATALPPAGDTFPARPTQMEMTVNNVAALATVRFLRSGADIDARIREVLYRVKHQGLMTVHLLLNLEDPLTPRVSEMLERYGFVFTGIVPGVAGGDLVSFQYFNGIVVDYDAVQVDSEMGRALLDYIRRRDFLGRSDGAF